MTTRPTRIAQTSKEAQREYKKNGSRIPERQRRQLERGHELDQRATRARELDERKRAAKKKREEKERKEQAARRQQGVGLATQLVGYNHTQAKLKTGMEAFLGLRKKREEEDRMKELETRKRLEEIVEEMEKEPWDDDDAMEAALDGLPLPESVGGDTLIDDDLDDETLLEVHDLVMSDPVEEIVEQRHKGPPPPFPLHAPVSSPSKRGLMPSPSNYALSKEDMDFLRLHGPINKAIEDALARLPEPLIELLSIDTSSNPDCWEPQASLLHKLNPLGLPPHRLRVKVGCAITLLRDLNSSSQLSKSSHLRILRVEKERLECLVIDGQLEGTKTILTRVPFPANYRNDAKCPFQRLQFPVRVSTDIPVPSAVRDTSQATFKLPSMPSAPKQLASTFKKPAMPASKTKPTSNVNPVFRPPRLPASKTVRKVQAPVAPVIVDGWDDFLDSATQIARELRSDDLVPPCKNSAPQPIFRKAVASDDFELTIEDLEAFEASDPAPANLAVQQRPVPQMEISIQDLDFTAEDLEDLALSQSQHTRPLMSATPAHYAPPRLRLPKTTIKPSSHGSSIPPPSARPVAPTMPPPSRPPPLKRKASSPSTTAPRQNPAPLKRPTPSGSSKPIHHPPRTRPRPLQTPSLKQPTAYASNSTPAPKVQAPLKPIISFSDFGLSTQDAVSFFDDDDFSSPTITV